MLSISKVEKQSTISQNGTLAEAKLKKCLERNTENLMLYYEQLQPFVKMSKMFYSWFPSFSFLFIQMLISFKACFVHSVSFLPGAFLSL